MAERTFRVLGAAPPMDAGDRRAVAGEVVRLRALLVSLPGAPVVRATRNPAGLLGAYVGLLMDATARGLPRAVVLPAAVRRRHGGRRWFAVSLEALDSFAAQFAGGHAAAPGPTGRDAGGTTPPGG